MKRARSKSKVIGRVLDILLSLNLIYSILMLILGEEIVMGNPVLHAIWDVEPYILMACALLCGLVNIFIWLWEKKHLPKDDEPLPQNDEQHPPTD